MNDDESQRLIRDAEDYTRGRPARRDVPLNVIAERVICEFLRDWDRPLLNPRYRAPADGARALISRLADAGAIVTPDADGSEHPGAHALRQAADRAAEGRPSPVPLPVLVKWLRDRADELEAGDHA